MRGLPNIPVVWAHVPQGAMLDIDNWRVLMDESFKNYPEGAQKFASYHEKAHVYYDTPISGRKLEYEKACDEEAAAALVGEGFSRTQIEFFMDLVLSPGMEKDKRIKNIKRFLCKMPY